MATQFNCNDTIPAAPAGRVNIKWQSDISGNVSANIPDYASGGAGHVIADEGNSLAARITLNFVGAGVTVTDDSVNNRTVVNIPGGSGGGSQTPWLSDIDGNNKKLTNVDIISTNGDIASGGNIVIANTSGTSGNFRLDGFGNALYIVGNGADDRVKLMFSGVVVVDIGKTGFLFSTDQIRINNQPDTGAGMWYDSPTESNRVFVGLSVTTPNIWRIYSAEHGDGFSYNYTTGYLTLAGGINAPNLITSGNNCNGDWTISNPNLDTGFTTAALEIRESNLAGWSAAVQANPSLYRPRIAFHWGSNVANQLVMDEGGNFHFMNANQGAYVAVNTGQLIVQGPLTVNNSTTMNASLYFSHGNHQIVRPADAGYEWWMLGQFNSGIGELQIVRRRISDGGWNILMTMLPNGNVGIGHIINPTVTCDVNGPIKCTTGIQLLHPSGDFGYQFGVGTGVNQYGMIMWKSATASVEFVHSGLGGTLLKFTNGGIFWPALGGGAMFRDASGFLKC